MNELQLIRSEIAAERRHAREVAMSCISKSADFSRDKSDTYNVYFSLIIDLEQTRIGSHVERLRQRLDLSDAERSLIERCALESNSLATPHDALERKAECVMRLCDRLEALEAVAESRYRLDDWRRTAHVDADSILEERRLRKELLAQSHGPAFG